jgi:GTP-binding protein LepA
MTDLAHIRNFSIIAHIDHGKSTLADRLIQYCGGLTAREMKEQVLDSMDIERERGITIKAQTVRLEYKAKDGKTYTLNLMDTPGHVDFAYEVSRCLAACEGALLVVDASQGVEAQTLANVYQAIDANLEIVPVLNKVDLPAAEPERVRQQIEDVIGIDASHAIAISAKTGLNIERRARSGRHRLPPPKGDARRAAQGAAGRQLVRFLSRRRRAGARGRWRTEARPVHPHDGGQCRLSGGARGRVHAEADDGRSLGPGEIGFITAQIKQVADTQVGDTITDERRGAETPLPGFKPRSRWCSAAVSGRCRAVRRSARRARQAASERCELHL